MVSIVVSDSKESLFRAGDSAPNNGFSFSNIKMRYHYEKPSIIVQMYGETYECNHPVYSRCTLFKIGSKGLSVIQQRFSRVRKSTWWDSIDPWLANDIYLHPGFREYFEKNASECQNGLYTTVTVRQIMWALKMKPVKRERWETVFDRKHV